MGCEFDRHGGVSNPLAMPPWPERGSGHGEACEHQSVVTSTATGTPLVTMS